MPPLPKLKNIFNNFTDGFFKKDQESKEKQTDLTPILNSIQKISLNIDSIVATENLLLQAVNDMHFTILDYFDEVRTDKQYDKNKIKPSIFDKFINNIKKQATEKITNFSNKNPSKIDAESSRETKIEQEKDDISKEHSNAILQSSDKTLKAIEKLVDKIYKKISNKSGLGNVAGGLGQGLGKGIEGFLGGIGKGLSSLGKGIASLGAGIGKSIQFFFEGLAKGLRALSDPKLLIGVAIIAALGASLWISAKGFQAFAEVSWGDVVKGAVALGILGAAAFALGAIMESGAGAVAILLGAAAIAALGAALIPAAYAANLAAPLFESLAKTIEALGVAISGIVTAAFGGLTLLFDSLSQLDPMQLMLIGPALASIGIGLAALTGGSLLSSFGDFIGGLFGANSPIQKLEKLADIGPKMQVLSSSLEIVVEQLKSFQDVMDNISSEELEKIGSALVLVSDGFVYLAEANAIINGMDFMGGLLGGTSITEKIKEISDLGPGLEEFSQALQQTNEELRTLFDSLSNIDAQSIYNLGPALASVSAGLLELSAANAAASLVDAATRFFGGDTGASKIDKLSQSAPGISLLADALDRLNVDDVDLLIEKLKELDNTLLGMQFAKLSVNVSSMFDKGMSEYQQLFGIKSENAVETQSDKIVPVRIVETSDKTNNITNILKEKSIEDRISVMSQGKSGNTSIVNSNVQNSGGNTIHASSVGESSTNNEPLLLKASKGDLELM
jgi:hypothetical protein